MKVKQVKSYFGFFGQEEELEYRYPEEKPFGSEKRTNKLNPHADNVESENGTRSDVWKANVLFSDQSLFSIFIGNVTMRFALLFSEHLQLNYRLRIRFQ